ncbi:MAG TPA: hypothetical protein VHK24_02030, partial [Steroidobacter sp.]|nr:hypothetical protein [Steroidobacter sp.]
MGIGTYLRRRIAKPIVEKLDAQGQLLCEMHIRALLNTSPYDAPLRLERFGFRSFSQNDEDGIIQEIYRRIGIETATFVEFGVENGLENNSRLLLNQGWRGLWLEGNVRAARSAAAAFAAEIAAGRLQLRSTFVTRENINELIASAKFDALDLLSIDVDGNDYWIWEAVAAQPRVVVIEYNAKFRPPSRWVMAYKSDHRWTGGDYHGASLQSLIELGERKGYVLVGCCLAGVNAFFVRKDLVQDRFAVADSAALYNPPRFYLHSMLACGHPAEPFGAY